MRAWILVAVALLLGLADCALVAQICETAADCAPSTSTPICVSGRCQVCGPAGGCAPGLRCDIATTPPYRARCISATTPDGTEPGKDGTSKDGVATDGPPADRSGPEPCRDKSPCARHLKSSGSVRVHGLVVDQLGFVFVTGIFTGNLSVGGKAHNPQSHTERERLFLACYDPKGLVKWLTVFPDGKDEQFPAEFIPYGIATHPSGKADVYVTGWMRGSFDFKEKSFRGSANATLFVARISRQSGTIEAMNAGPDPQSSVGFSLAVLENNHAYLAGVGSEFTGLLPAHVPTPTQDPKYRMFVVQVLPNGDFGKAIYWIKGSEQHPPDPGIRAIKALHLDAAGKSLYLAGFAFMDLQFPDLSTRPPMTSDFVLALDGAASGALKGRWVTTMQVTETAEFIQDIKVGDGVVFAVGHTSRPLKINGTNALNPDKKHKTGVLVPLRSVDGNLSGIRTFISTGAKGRFQDLRLAGTPNNNRVFVVGSVQNNLSAIDAVTGKASVVFKAAEGVRLFALRFDSNSLPTSYHSNNDLTGGLRGAGFDMGAQRNRLYLGGTFQDAVVLKGNKFRSPTVGMEGGFWVRWIVRP